MENNGLNVSKTELISTFLEIDSKINSLHRRSTVDFMQLNDYLKDYHTKTKIISENAFRAIETIAGNKEINLTEELDSIYRRLEDCAGKIKTENLRKINVLKDLLTEANRLNILLRNYKQDFTTFKFLATNFALLSNYEDFGSEWKENLEDWNKEVHSIQNSLANVYEIVKCYKENLSMITTGLENKLEKSIRTLDQLSKVIWSNIDLVLQKSNESKTKLPLLREKTAASARSIGNIITHLQYHDIIRQKIEHIQKAHFNIIDDLKRSRRNRFKSGEDIHKQFYRIGDITDLQAAQLLLVSKEFQNAIDVITRNFIGITKDITAISAISKDFSFRDGSSEDTLLKQVKDQLDAGIHLLDMNDYREINTEYLKTIEMIEEVSVLLTSRIQQPLRTLANFDRLKDKSAEGSNYIPGVVTQILLLTGDMEVKNYEICEKINEIRLLSRNVVEKDEMDSLGSRLEQSRISLMVDMTRVLDSLDRESNTLDKVLGENRELNEGIIGRIEEVITTADYYEYFDKTVEEVINRLNSINSRLRPGGGRKENEISASNVESIRLNYTMESERVVHEAVTLGGASQSLSPVEDAYNEIEFF